MLMYSERFLKWYDMIKRFEGVYGNDPSDSGGETYHGICRKFYPNLKVWKSLDKLPLSMKKKYNPTPEEEEEIRDIYFKGYWCKSKGDYINDVNLAFQIADFGVNAGIINSIKKLQKIVGTTQDGIIGNITLNAVNSKPDTLNKFINERINYYNKIAQKGNNKKFLKGWLNRVNNCKYK